jgi:hypothetical protein
MEARWDQGQVHGFLHRSGGDHGKPGLADAHDIAVIPENGQRVGGKALADT